jgi:hypothetical protein
LISYKKKQVKNLTKELGKANEEISYLVRLSFKQDENSDPEDKKLNLTDYSRMRKLSATPLSTESGKKGELNTTGDIKSPEAIHKRMIDSINTVRELLQANKELSETIESQGNKIDSLVAENYQVIFFNLLILSYSKKIKISEINWQL